ncbi:MAG: MFS transporter [Acidimicrobiales bacterium]
MLDVQQTRSLPRHIVVFGSAATAVFALSFDSTLLPIALRDIGSGVGETTPSHLSWLSTTYTIAMAASVVAIGRIGDRTGRRRLFLLGFTLFLVGALVAGTATTFTQVLAGRSIEGLGAACVFPSSLGLVLAAWPANQATKAIAAWTAVGGVAGAIGPAVGSALVDGLGWRSAFLVHLVIGIPALLVARRVLVETERHSKSSLPDMVGSLLVAVVLGSMALVLAQARTWGFSDDRIVIALVLIAITLPLLVWRCMHHPAPVVEPQMLRLRTYRRTVVLCVFVAGAIFANFVMMPQYLGTVWGYSTFRVGMAIVPFSIAASITAVWGGRVSARVDEKWLLALGITIMAAAMAWLRFVPDETPDYWTEFFPAIIMTGVGGWGMALSMLNCVGARELDNSNYGVGMGILMTMRQVGSLAGVATAFGILGDVALTSASAIDRIRQVWLLLIPVFLVSAVATARLPARQRHSLT